MDVETAADTFCLNPKQVCQVGRVQIEFGDIDHHRSSCTETAAAERDQTYLLVIPVQNELYFSQSGLKGRVAPRDYLLIDRASFFELAAEGPAPAWVLHMPAADLDGRLPTVSDHLGRRFETNKQMAQLVLELITSIARTFHRAPPPNPEALATEILSFVTLAIGSEDRGGVADVRNSRYRLRRRIFDFIDNHLADVDLSPKRIANDNGISLSYLYSLFNDQNTTVGQFVQIKRLQRAYEMLVADPAGRITISEIAYQVGFKNTSHFSRSFSRHFDMTPKEARQGRRPCAKSSHVPGRGTGLDVIPAIPLSVTPPFLFPDRPARPLP